MIRAALLALAALAAAAPAAAAPRVVADIAPVHALAARVMAGAGAPELLLPPGASPHGYALRPSQARALARADLVFAVGPALTPWLSEALETLAPDARRVELGKAPGLTRRPVRAPLSLAAGETQGAHAHAADHGHGDAPAGDHGHGRDDGHGDAGNGHHEAHDDGHGHDDAHGRDDAAHARDDADHAHGEDGAEGHAHEAAHARGDGAARSEGDDPAAAPHAHDHSGPDGDPHYWLDPANAAVWLAAMAEALAEADPANAELYAANARAAQAELAALSDDIAARLAGLRDRPYVVFHDAYRHFEARFDIPAEAAVTLGDGRRPGARRVAALRDLIAERGVVCLFAEPQFPPRLLDTLAEGAEVRSGTLDPLGADLEPGADLYPRLLRGLAEDMAACLRG